MNLRNKLTLVNANPNESTPLSRAIFFIIIGVAFYLLDRFCLFYLDDYMYAYKFGTYEPIRTMKDIIESQYDHYFLYNGRFLVHCVVQLFCGILGIEWFRIFNTLFFVAFCGLTVRLVYNTWTRPIVYYAVVSLMLWLFIPRISFTVLGNISCCVNYLWVGVATICFLLLWEKIKLSTDQFEVKKVGLVVFGAVVGSLQESFSIPIAGALFLYYCFNISKFRGVVAWLVLGYWMGTLMLVFAPANFIRLNATSNYIGIKSFLFDSVYRAITILFDYTPFLIFGIVILIWLIVKNSIAKHLKENNVYYIMLFIAILFPILVAYINSHQLFFAGWLVILLFLRLINVSLHNTYIYIMAIIFIPMYIGIYIAMQDISEKRNHRIDNIINSTNGTVVAEYGDNDLVKYPRLIRRYINIPMNEIVEFMNYASLYYTGSIDKFKTVLPCSVELLLDNCSLENNISEGVYFFSNYNCYVLKLPISKTEYQVNVVKEYPLMSYYGIISLLKDKDLISESIVPDYELFNLVEIDGYNYICYYPNTYDYKRGRVIGLSVI